MCHILSVKELKKPTGGGMEVLPLSGKMGKACANKKRSTSCTKKEGKEKEIAPDISTTLSVNLPLPFAAITPRKDPKMADRQSEGKSRANVLGSLSASSCHTGFCERKEIPNLKVSICLT